MTVWLKVRADVALSPKFTAVYEECKKQTVTILGFYGADQAVGVDPEVKKRWEKDVAAVAFQNYIVTFSHQNLHQMMDKAGIPYVVLNC